MQGETELVDMETVANTKQAFVTVKLVMGLPPPSLHSGEAQLARHPHPSHQRGAALPNASPPRPQRIPYAPLRLPNCDVCVLPDSSHPPSQLATKTKKRQRDHILSRLSAKRPRPGVVTRKMEQSASANSLLSPPELSPLEQEVLDEYERLAENMKKVRLPHPWDSGAQRGIKADAGNSPQKKTDNTQPCAGETARIDDRPPRFQPQQRHPRRPAGARAQDEPGVHASQGQRVQHRPAAGD